MRDFGCTRVEIGVQATSDKILEINKRGHGVKEIVDATKNLRQYGFKVTYHFMPALPGSTPSKDFKMFEQMFSDERFQPDQIKFYPTVVTKGSLLYKWWLDGKYKAYSDKQLRNLIIKCKAIVPKYLRIIRLIRDIPRESIEAGNKITNLRQIMKDEGLKCNCIRCRESRDKKVPKKLINEVISYSAGGGKEHFISLTDIKKETLYGFCRLRIDKNSPVAPAIVRELHVYGQLVPVGEKKKTQHAGLGRRLMKKAEEIAKQEKANEVAVISGVGVRGYYRHLGYKLKNTYLRKSI
jgi:elongator complex protein 3